MALTPKARKHIRVLEQALNKVEAAMNLWQPSSMARTSCQRTLEAKRFLVKSAQNNPTDSNVQALLNTPIPKVWGSCVVWNVRENAGNGNVNIL